jgi:hypothetical protein
VQIKNHNVIPDDAQREWAVVSGKIVTLLLRLVDHLDQLEERMGTQTEYISQMDREGCRQSPSQNERIEKIEGRVFSEHKIEWWKYVAVGVLFVTTLVTAIQGYTRAMTELEYMNKSIMDIRANQQRTSDQMQDIANRLTRLEAKQP